MLSPSGILLAGAAAALTIGTGLPLLVAPVAAVAAWAARVGVAVPRDGRPERIDPFTLGEPWRRFVQEALQAQARYQAAVTTSRDGPLRTRLDQIGERVADGVEACWRIARRGQQLVEARSHLDTTQARQELDRLSEDADETWARGSAIEDTVEALRSQLETAERMDEVIAETIGRLQLLDARLDEAVARAIELSVSADDTTDLAGLGADVEGVVSEMEALRLALDETSSTGTTGTTGTSEASGA